MVEIFRTQNFESALNTYLTWVNRSITLGFYPASVALVSNGYGWSILIVAALNDAYFSTPSL